jgi:hypothetical protein
MNVMDLVLRAYDHHALLRAEAEPVERLWTLLGSGGFRDKAKAGAGLTAPLDPFARETVASRLESLIQEGYGAASLARLRGAEPLDLATLRRRQWPAIPPREAVELREDLVRYLTYGLWQAPELTLAQILALLTARPVGDILQGSAGTVEALEEVIDAVTDDAAFAARFATAVRAGLAEQGRPADYASVRHELAILQQSLGPAGRLLLDARRVDLRVICYQDGPEEDGLSRLLAAEMGQREPRSLPHIGENGWG